MNSYSIRVHPGIINMMDGDFDGDVLNIVCPISKEAIEDLPKMDVLQFINRHPEEFNPSKEIAKYQDGEWSLNQDVLENQINKIKEESTNGKSISYHDLLDPEYPGSYFENTKVDRKELASFANGISEEKLLGMEETDISGATVEGAVESQRTIKGLTPKCGAIANNIMTLAIAKTWDWDEKDKLRVLHSIARIKHILCQDGLSAKHGTNTIKGVDALFDAIYCTQKNQLETESEYVECITSFGIPEADAVLMASIFWMDIGDKPVNINKQLSYYAPSYLMTRRFATPGHLEYCLINPAEKNLHVMFLEEMMRQDEMEEI
jgi:hypothetical protein